MDGADWFDSIDDRIDCGNDVSLNISEEITIETWINNQFEDGSVTLSSEATENLFGDLKSSLVVADLDDDGTLEIVIGSADGNLYVLSHSGSDLTIEDSHATGVIKGSAAVADVDDDGDLFRVGDRDHKIGLVD